MHDKTIIAQITYPGKSAVGILRISGSQAKIIAKEVLGKIPLPRFATYSKFLDEYSNVLDKGISLWFPAPCSLTGEDVLELQGHGSPLVMDLLIKRILSINNTRLAKPGEFSERAFLNGKIDLIQSEAIDDLINSETESSVRASLHSLEGDFSFFIKELMNIIIEFRINLESTIDFSEEEITIDLENIINTNFKKLHLKFLKIKNTAKEGILLKEGKKIVIAGLPNSGKSSLLNVLSCKNRAIVSDIPGTTRDLLYAYININNISCELIDTAGLRNTDNKVENIGIMRAWEVIKTADHILFVIDKTIKKSEQEKICHEFIKNLSDSNIKVTFILNKNDLLQEKFGMKKMAGLSFISISARTGEGIDTLRQHIIKLEKDNTKEGVFIARRRHLHQIDLAYNELLLAEKNWLSFKNVEFLAESLSIINKLLGEITGHFSSQELLKRIFSNFCIGK